MPLLDMLFGQLRLWMPPLLPAKLVIHTLWRKDNFGAKIELWHCEITFQS